VPNFYHAAAAFALALVLLTPAPSRADTFGSGSNTFEISFVQISQTNNVNDPASGNIYGAVPYEYRASIYEISQNAITKATASGMANVTAGAWTNQNQPAANITWYEAAAFVNWLNTSSGKTAAYNLTFSGSWSMTLQSSSNAWTLGGTNLYRNKDAYYFLPSEDEWYKAAYYNPAGSNYFLYPTASSSVPTSVASGTNAGTAVFYASGAGYTAPAVVTTAGGLSPYGTMGQGGNVRDLIETAADGVNDSPTDTRSMLGGFWGDTADVLSSTGNRQVAAVTLENPNLGFRVASVPEPSTYALLLLGAGAMYLWKRRQGSL
jgi:formylglycine-generating enzyme required for sulfatase activity